MSALKVFSVPVNANYFTLSQLETDASLPHQVNGASLKDIKYLMSVSLLYELYLSDWWAAKKAVLERLTDGGCFPLMFFSQRSCVVVLIYEGTKEIEDLREIRSLQETRREERQGKTMYTQSPEWFLSFSLWQDLALQGCLWNCGTRKKLTVLILTLWDPAFFI